MCGCHAARAALREVFGEQQRRHAWKLKCGGKISNGEEIGTTGSGRKAALKPFPLALGPLRHRDSRGRRRKPADTSIWLKPSGTDDKSRFNLPRCFIPMSAAIPSFATRTVVGPLRPINTRSGREGLHYGGHAGKGSIWRLGGDLGGGCGGSSRPELGEELLGFVWRGVAAEDHGASIGSREMDVEDLHGAELLEDRARKPAWGALSRSFWRRVAWRQKARKATEDMRAFDAVTVEDRTQAEIRFEVFEGFLICVEHVELPDLGRVICAEVGA